MKVAAIQMVSATTLQANLVSAYSLLKEAADQGTELAVLPEYFCLLGGRDTDKLAIAEAYGSGPIQQFLADTARELQLWIVGGTLPLTLPDTEGDMRRVFNTSLVYSPAGNCVARYDKIHLFRFDNGQEAFDESRVLQRGNQPTMFEISSRDDHIWRVGLSICYDLRFPVWARQQIHSTAPAEGTLIEPEYHILIYVANWPERRSHAWKTLLCARAIENQCYAVGVNRVGKDGNDIYHSGNSMLIDPLGEVLYHMADDEDIFTITLQKEHEEQIRTKFPFWKDADDFKIEL